MNTSTKSPQVFILNHLQEMLSPLESALTKKGGRGVVVPAVGEGLAPPGTEGGAGRDPEHP